MIKDGVVKIVSIAREEGSRTKISVKAEVPNVDPVGACVGINGARVKAIVNELGNEQIDIIEWDENPAQYIVNALSPAKLYLYQHVMMKWQEGYSCCFRSAAFACNRQGRTECKTCSKAYRLWH